MTSSRLKNRMPAKRARSGPSLPIDVLAQVLSHCYTSPRHVFIGIKACKGLRRYLTDDWWAAFWAAHKAHIANRAKGPHYQMWYMRPNAFANLRMAQVR